MTQHFTRATVSAEFWCPKCKKRTQHQICDRRKGACLECVAKLDQLYEEHRKFARESAEQKGLFDA